MKKGVSPLIAAVILIAFVIAVAGIASTFFTGFVKEKPINREVCISHDEYIGLCDCEDCYSIISYKDDVCWYEVYGGNCSYRLVVRDDLNSSDCEDWIYNEVYDDYENGCDWDGGCNSYIYINKMMVER